MVGELYNQAHTLLQKVAGAGAQFRDGQWEAIQALVQDHERVLVVQKTGWGKSIVYFIATRLLRIQGAGMTILISPLLSLMRNQIDAANKLGIRAVSINSGNRDAWDEIEADLLAGKIDLLLISPERLRNDRFQEVIWTHLKSQIGLFAVDEAHCISDWGHDFRPDYRRIMGLLGELPPNTPILGTTATANDRVIDDVAEIIGADFHIQRGALARESLELYAVPEALSQAERLTLLVKLLQRMNGSGIIYCTTTATCALVAEWLQKQGYRAKPYYSGVEQDYHEEREDLERQLLDNEVDVLVASIALGMGFDKPDLHFVIHFQYPGSIISYYQQIGRAGRGIDNARIVLLHGHEDMDIQQYFIESAFPRPKDVQQVVELLGEQQSMKRNDLQRFVNVKPSVLNKILVHLELEGIIEKDQRQYRLLKQTSPDYDRWARVSAQRQQELGQMQAYLNHDGCLMRFIADVLNDPTVTKDCGRCQNCRDVRIYSNPTPEEVDNAMQFLTKERFIFIEPRKMFPTGGSVDGLKGRISSPNERGIALCYLDSGGWADMVKEGKFKGGRFDPQLVQVCAERLQHYWATLGDDVQLPRWITYVPSLRSPRLLPEFCEGLARALRLPLHHVLKKQFETPRQIEMHNSHQQLKNVWNVFEVSADIPSEAVLLVDDIVYSGWTLTAIGELFNQRGVEDVMPFALAKLGR